VLKNEQLAEEIRQKGQQVQAALADQEQTRQLVAEKADLERQQAEVARQKALLDLEMQRVELLKAQLEAQRLQLTYEAERVSVALELAGKMIDRLRPNVDELTRAMLIQTLLPELLQLGNAKGLQLPLLPADPADGSAMRARGPNMDR
jgi:hypothetical protein